MATDDDPSALASRREFLQKSLALGRSLLWILALTFGFQWAHAATFVYVSNAADGTISVYRLAESTGKLTPVETAASGARMSCPWQ